MRVLMLVMSDVVGDARVARSCTTLSEAGHSVHVIGLSKGEGPPPLGQAGVRVQHVRARSPFPTSSRRLPTSRRAVRWLLLPTHRRSTEHAFRCAARACAADVDADVVHAHDFPTLPLALELAAQRSAPVVYDSHECWTQRSLEGRPTPLRRWLDQRAERQLGGRADAVLTVSPGIAEWMRDHYGWPHVHVVRNTFPRAGPPDGLTLTTPRALVYAGRIDAKRDLPTVVAAASQMPELPIRLVGPGDARFMRTLDTRSVSIEPPVEIEAVSALYRQTGLALVPLADQSLNHRLALPNKLFQALAAGVPVVAADLPELRRVVQGHGVGTLYRPGDSASLVAAVRRAVDRYPALTSAVQASAGSFQWEQDARILLAVYDSLPTRETTT